MRTNGTIKYKTTTQGGIDDNGDTKQAVAAWSEPIECLIIPNGRGTILKYKDGEQVKASYEIHLEGLVQFESNPEIEVFNGRGASLGTFIALDPNIQELRTAGRTSIVI